MAQIDDHASRLKLQAGGTLPPDAPSYIERKVDDELRRALMGGEYVFVLDSRQIGKSSLIAKTTVWLRSHGLFVVNLDLTRFGSSGTVDQWYYSMLKQIGEAVGHWTALQQRFRSSLDETPSGRFFGALGELASMQLGRVVIFVDEVDAVLNLPFDADEFFAGIRELFGRRALEPDLSNLTFCLVGSATPGKLIRTPTSTPFNIGRQLSPTDFELSELEDFSTRFGFDQGVIHEVFHWAGGHPYLSQRLLAEVLESSGTRRVSQIVDQLYFQKQAQDADHLAHVSRRIVGSEEFSAAPQAFAHVLNRAKSWRPIKSDAASPVQNVLKISGLCKVAGDRIVVRNRIYARAFGARWMEEVMPGTMLRHLRHARWVAGLALTALALVTLFTTRGHFYILGQLGLLEVRSYGIEATRGSIRDRDGKELAGSTLSNQMTVDRRRVPTDSKFWQELSAASNIDERELRRQTNRTSAWEFERQLTDLEVEQINSVKLKHRADGVGILRRERRRYGGAEPMSTVVGELRDGDRAFGLERNLQSVLGGKRGHVSRLFLKLPWGRVAVDEQRAREENGQDVELTVESSIQQAAYESVREAVQRNRAELGSAVVLDVQTGEILALASYPGLAPGANPLRQATVVGTSASPEANYAVCGMVEPGGLIMPIILALGLDLGVVNVNDTFVCQGSYGRVRDSGSAHGAITFARAVSRSCSPALASLATKVGYERLTNGLEKFGVFGKPIGVLGAREALFNKQEPIRTLQLQTLGIGLSISGSPLTWASGLATLANQGRRIEPQLVRRIGRENLPAKEPVQVVQPQSARYALDALRNDPGMLSQVSRGVSNGVTFFGKSATILNSVKPQQRVISSYAAFMPAETPEVVILVTVVDSKAAQFYGALVAGPAVAATAQFITTRRAIK